MNPQSTLPVPLFFTRTIHASIGWVMVLSVVALSLLPNTQPPDISPIINDKLAHGVAYGVLFYWFACIVVRTEWQRLLANLFALGLSLECCQYLLPYREATFADLAANLAGLAVGLAIAEISRRSPSARK